MYTVAIDDGHAYTKGAYYDETGNIRTIAIKTLVTPGAHVSVSYSGAQAGNIYTTEDAQYTVGDVFAGDSRYESYQFSPANRVMVHHLLWQIGCTPDTPITLSVSTPMGNFLDRSEREAIIQRRQSNLTVPVYPLDTMQSLQVQHVTVYPEAAAAYIDVLLNEDGSDACSAPPRMAIVDIGGRTTDVAIIYGGNIHAYNSGTEELGALNIIHDIATEIAKEFQIKTHRIHLMYDMAETAIHSFSEHGEAEVVIYGKSRNITQIVKNIRKQFLEQIVTIVERRIGDAAVTLDKILFIGGGAAMLRKEILQLQRKMDHIDIHPIPQFANALGMLKYAKFIREGA